MPALSERSSRRFRSTLRDSAPRPVCERLEIRHLLAGAIFQTSNTVTSSDNGGPIISSPRIALVFWGANWGNGTAAPAAATVQSAVDTIVTSPYLGQLSTYRAALGSGLISNVYTITSSSPPASFTGSNVASMLQTNINNGTLPRPTTDANLLYTVVPQNGTSSPGLNGQHSFSTDNQNNRFHYAWTINNGTIDLISNTLSHEVVEAMTDPEGDAIQVNPRNASAWNEVADGTAQSYSAWYNGFQLQSYWVQSRQAYLIPFAVTGGYEIDATSAGNTLIVNGDQLVAGQDDEFIVNKDSAGRIEITINNQTIAFARGAGTGQYSGVKFVGKAGADDLSIGANVDFPVTFEGGDGYDNVYFMGTSGDDTVTFNTNKPVGSGFDVFGSDAEQYNVTTFEGNDTINVNDSNRNITLIGGSGSNTYNINSITSVGSTFLTVFGGDASDVVNVAPGASSNAVQTPITVYGNGGDDVVNLGPNAAGAAITAPVTFNGDDGNDTLHLGAGNADSVAANVTFNGDGSPGGLGNMLVYNDQSAAYQVSYDVGPGGVTRQGFFAPRTVSYANTSRIVINAGSDSDLINVRNGVGPVLEAHGNNGDDIFTRGVVNPGGGALFDGGPGSDTITFDGTAENVNRLWDIYPDRVIYAGIVNYLTTGFESVAVLAGGGSDTVTFFGGSTTYGTAIVVDAGGGDDSFNTNATKIPNLTVRGGTGHDYLNVDDRGIATNIDESAFTPTSVIRYTTSGTFTVNYSQIEDMDFHLPNQQNYTSVYGTSPDIAAGYSSTIWGNVSNDYFVVYPHDGAGNLALASNLNIDAGASADNIVIEDGASLLPINYTFTNLFSSSSVGHIQGMGPGYLGFYNTAESLTVNAGGGNDSFNINSYRSGTALAINAGDGDDTLNFGNTNLAADVTNIASFSFNGQMGSDTFNLNNTAAGESFSYDRGTGTLGASGNSSGYNLGLNESNTELVRINDGPLSGTFYVPTLPAGTALNINAGGGYDLLNAWQMVTLGSFITSINGRLDYDAGPGGGGLRVWNNFGTGARTAHVDVSSIGAYPGDNLFGAGGSIHFAGLSDSGSTPGVDLQFGRGNDTIYAQPLPNSSVVISGGGSGTAGDALNLALAAAQNYAINNTGAGSGNVTSSNLKTLSWSGIEQPLAVDDVAPAVVHADINLEGVPALTQAALLHQAIDVQFSEDVSALIAPGWLVLQNITTGQTIASANLAVEYDPASNTAHFTSPGYPSGALPDGNYSARILAGLPDFFGNGLPADAPFSFFVLAGDANHDRSVDVTDLGILATNWQGTGKTFADGDFNYDGMVDVTDLGILATNWQKSMPVPVAPVAPAFATTGLPAPSAKHRQTVWQSLETPAKQA